MGKNGTKTTTEGRPLKFIWLGAILSFCLASIFARVFSRFPGDLAATQGIQSLESGFLTTVMEVISLIGGGYVATLILIAFVVLFFITMKYRDSVLLLGILILTYVENPIKQIIERPRPSPDLVDVLQTNHSFSFPSGHTVTAIAFYGVIFYFSTIYLEQSPLKRIVQVIALSMILITGVSRIYLGAHWISDVIGGYLLGFMILWGLIAVHRKSVRKNVS